MTTASAWVVVCAAGAGKRLAGTRPKAFAALAGRPLLAESLERLDCCNAVAGIVIAAPPGWEEATILLSEELDCDKVSTVVRGGRKRGESVRLGLAEIPEEVELVLVHDAARPLVSAEVVKRVLDPLSEGWDAVVPALPLADTVKLVEAERVVETPERSSLVAVQTPQAFRAEVLRAAYAGEHDEATDCSTLVERWGGRVAWVEGDRRLQKVTTADDLLLVESWLAKEKR
ncbi:MAG TPA: 2-C-methyl-D-erythritol 4-phosphate cytidylyltransferase [Gaiellaceae bacterium]